MAPKKNTKAKTDIDQNKAEEDTISGVTVKEKLELAKKIAFDTESRPKDVLEALKFMVEIEGANIKKEESIHIFLDPEYVADYQAGKIELPAPPPIIK